MPWLRYRGSDCGAGSRDGRQPGRRDRPLARLAGLARRWAGGDPGAGSVSWPGYWIAVLMPKACGTPSDAAVMVMFGTPAGVVFSPQAPALVGSAATELSLQQGYVVAPLDPALPAPVSHAAQNGRRRRDRIVSRPSRGGPESSNASRLCRLSGMINMSPRAPSPIRFWSSWTGATSLGVSWCAALRFSTRFSAAGLTSPTVCHTSLGDAAHVWLTTP